MGRQRRDAPGGAGAARAVLLTAEGRLRPPHFRVVTTTPAAHLVSLASRRLRGRRGRRETRIYCASTAGDVAVSSPGCSFDQSEKVRVSNVSGTCFGR